MIDDLEHYLRTNRDRYTREALTAQAIKAGHSPADVEAAWRRISEPVATSAAETSRAPAQRSTGATIVVVLLIGVVILAYGGAILLGIAGVSFSGVPTVTLWLAVYSIAMFGGMLYSVRRLWLAPTEYDTAVSIVVAAGIAVAIFGGLCGFCAVGLDPLGGLYSRGGR